MRIKITVEVVSDNFYIPILLSEVDKIMRACTNGIMEKYRGRVENIIDTYMGTDPNFYGQISKSKMMSVVNEEEKKVE